MSKEYFRILDGSPLALAANKPDHDGYEQVVVQGAWKGHWQGEFQVNEAMIHQMADAGNSRKIATPIDYGHEMTFDSSADAGGWVEPGNFEIRGKGKSASLFAKIDFTEKARAKIAAQELRYKSPTIFFNTVDRKTGRTGGASLHSIALTNTPFLHELPELRLNSIMAAIKTNEKETLMNEDQIKALAKLFGLAETATVDEILAASAGKKIVAADELTALQVRATATDGSQEQIKVLQSQLAAIQKAEQDRNALDLVRSMQAARKVAGDETENFKCSLEHAKSNPEGFKALMNSIQPWVAGGDPVVRTTNTEEAHGLTDLAKTINRKLGVSDETYIKYNGVK